MSLPYVSVVIPCFNIKKLLELNLYTFKELVASFKDLLRANISKEINFGKITDLTCYYGS